MYKIYFNKLWIDMKCCYLVELTAVSSIPLVVFQIHYNKFELNTYLFVKYLKDKWKQQLTKKKREREHLWDEKISDMIIDLI